MITSAETAKYPKNKMRSAMSLREDIVRAATELLDEGGPENVTLREVGNRTGVSRTAPYLYFPNKLGLLAAVAALELRQLSTDVEALRAEGRRPSEVLRLAMKHYVRWSANRPERFRLVFRSWKDESDELVEAADRANDLMVTLVKECQSEGVLPRADPWSVAAAIRSFAHGAAVLAQAGHLLGEDRQPLDAEQLVNAYLGSDPTVVFNFAMAQESTEVISARNAGRDTEDVSR